MGRELERPLGSKASYPLVVSCRPGATVSNVPEGLRYTKDHEWAKVEGNRIRVGVTDHAQRELTDVVYVELPTLGNILKKGEQLGVVESVKAVSEIYAPVTGKVVEVNSALEDTPEAVNKDPYGAGWMVVLETADATESSGLMDAAAYRKHIGE